MGALCCVTLHLLFELLDHTVLGTYLSPTLTIDMPATDPDDSQALFSPCHQFRSIEIRSQDGSSLVPVPTVEAVEAAQTLA